MRAISVQRQASQKREAEKESERVGEKRSGRRAKSLALACPFRWLYKANWAALKRLSSFVIKLNVHAWPKNTKLPSCNPSALHPPLLVRHLTPDRYGNEATKCGKCSCSTWIKSNRLRLRLISYLNMSTAFGEWQRILCCLCFFFFFHAFWSCCVRQSTCVCVCVAMLCRVVSFSFASLASPAKRFMCAFCRLLVAPPGVENAYLFLWHLLKRILTMFSLV